MPAHAETRRGVRLLPGRNTGPRGARHEPRPPKKPGTKCRRFRACPVDPVLWTPLTSIRRLATFTCFNEEDSKISVKDDPPELTFPPPPSDRSAVPAGSSA